MSDREKVIRGLELCAYDPDLGQTLKEVQSCPKCPYYLAGCSVRLISDALALLKEQKARVMTLQEAVDYGYAYGEAGDDNGFPPVFIEYFDDRKCYVHWWAAGQVNLNLYQTVTLREDYNQAIPEGFRLWTARPSEEQRKAVKWDEDNA